MLAIQISPDLFSSSEDQGLVQPRFENPQDGDLTATPGNLYRFLTTVKSLEESSKSIQSLLLVIMAKVIFKC